MKRVAIKSSSRFLLAIILLLSCLIFDSGPVEAASVGSNQCIQNIDVTTDVSVYQDTGSCYVAFKGIRTYNWTPPANIKDIDLLIVAGGGGGGSRHAGGGGAGGLINLTSQAINTSSLTITVGGGGAGGVATSNAGAEGSNGSDSTLSGGGIALKTAVGGGGGGYTLTSGSGGSSGGGGCCGQAIGTATAGQGNIGGAGSYTNGVIYVGGGGGGAGAVGNAGNSSVAGSGGSGRVISWITVNAQSALSVGVNVSSQIYFAGGGGGGSSSSSYAGGSGGNGGGGAGVIPTGQGGDATANTGGGGGGSGLSGAGASRGGNGGSGVVIIRYTIPVAYFIADSYTAGSATWPNIINGGTAGTTSTGGMAKVISGPSGVIFAGRESSNSDYMTSSIGSTTSLDTVTVEMWIRLKDSGSAQYTSGSMLFSWNSGNYNIYHYGNQVGFNNFNSQLYGIDSTSYNNVWTHFVFQMTDVGGWDTQKIYVNGVLQTSTCRVTPGNCTNSDTRVFDSSGSYRLMDNPYSANSWNAKGDIGLVRIYNTQLSAAQILQNYTVTQPDYVMPTNLVGSLTASGVASKGKNVTLTLTSVVDGKVQFLASGKRIPGCISRTTSGSYPNFSATCLWKPATSGYITVTARLTPNDSSFIASTSDPFNLFVLRRSDKR